MYYGTVEFHRMAKMKKDKIFTPEIIESFSQFIDRKNKKMILDAINKEPLRMVNKLKFTTPLSTSKKKKLLICVKNMFIQDLLKVFKEMDESGVLG